MARSEPEFGWLSLGIQTCGSGCPQGDGPSVCLRCARGIGFAMLQWLYDTIVMFVDTMDVFGPGIVQFLKYLT